MNSSGRAIAQALFGIPLLGRLLRIAVSVWKLPEVRQQGALAIEDLTRQLGEQRALIGQLERRLEEHGKQIQQHDRQLEEHGDRLAQVHREFERELERLTKTLVEEQGNFVKSVPVTLRQMTRELRLLQVQMRTAGQPAGTTLEAAGGAREEPV